MSSCYYVSWCEEDDARFTASACGSDGVQSRSNMKEVQLNHVWLLIGEMTSRFEEDVVNG